MELYLGHVNKQICTLSESASESDSVRCSTSAYYRNRYMHRSRNRSWAVETHHYTYRNNSGDDSVDLPGVHLVLERVPRRFVIRVIRDTVQFILVLEPDVPTTTPTPPISQIYLVTAHRAIPETHPSNYHPPTNTRTNICYPPPSTHQR